MLDREALENLEGFPSFTEWVPWKQRESIDGSNLPGVYALGQFDDSPPQISDVRASEVLYIGETVRNSLEGRWYQFGRSAFHQKSGHSGGWTFAARYMSNKVGDPPSWLHVAALPVKLEEPWRGAFIRDIERWAIWRYVKMNNLMPECNSK